MHVVLWLGGLWLLASAVALGVLGVLYVQHTRLVGPGRDQVETAPANPYGKTQYAGSHDACTEMERERAQGLVWPESRYHVRLNQTHHKDSVGRFETVATPHYDTAVGCGHAIRPDDPGTSNPDSGFDTGRGKLKNDYLAKYGSGALGDVQNWGNTATRLQCNDWKAGGSGRVYWLNTD